MKKVFSVPSSVCDMIFHVDAELVPPPPAEETLVLSGLRLRSFARDGSSFILDLVVSERASLHMLLRWT